jgi:DNA-binding GntR family transcriptional regulator
VLNGAGVLDAIRRDIVAGDLLPGTRVTEAFLAERYGVSRMPVREALRGLEGEGFVVSQPNVGSRIAAIPFDEADDLFAVREALEVATARRAATRARTLFDGDTPPADWWRVRRELGEVLDTGDRAVERDDLGQLVDLNERFHFLVAELSGSTTLATLLRQLSRKIEWLYAMDTFSRGKRLWPEHRQILSAIDAGDVETAVARMAAHVQQSRVGYAARTPDRAQASETGQRRRSRVTGSAGSAAGP